MEIVEQINWNVVNTASIEKTVPKKWGIYIAILAVAIIALFIILNHLPNEDTTING